MGGNGKTTRNLHFSPPSSFSLTIISQKGCNFKSYDWTLRKLQSHLHSLPSH